MVLIRASAPNKLHLCGEHSVVYGGKALMAPVELCGKRNQVTLTPSSSGFSFVGDLGKAVLKEGVKGGDSVYFPLLDVASFVSGKVGRPVPFVEAVLDYSGAPKGTGNSASLSVALALALYAHFGKNPTRQELYDAGFVGDDAYHGGKSSGGDVAAVLSNQAQLFWRVFQPDGSVKPVFQEVRLELPENTDLLLVSSDRGAPKATTTGMIELFAKSRGIFRKPAELSETERRAVHEPFDAVVEKIRSLCHSGADAHELGAAFDENHALLSCVSTPGIDEALVTAKKAGSLGGKLIGAGGEGGALIALVWKKDLAAIQSSLKAKGFESWPVKLAEKGPFVDNDSSVRGEGL